MTQTWRKNPITVRSPGTEKASKNWEKKGYRDQQVGRRNRTTGKISLDGVILSVIQCKVYI
jgi:hypothetical protein